MLIEILVVYHQCQYKMLQATLHKLRIVHSFRTTNSNDKIGIRL